MTQLLLKFTPYPMDGPITLPIHERPAYRVAADSAACNSAELLAALVGGPRQLRVAHGLLAQFGSLHGVARAGVADLRQVVGVGEITAARLKSTLEISRRLLSPMEDRPVIRSAADAASLLQPLLMHREQEYLVVLLLDTRNRVLAPPVEVYHGSLNMSLIRVGEVFRDAVRLNAAALILAHNHPSNDPSPSPEDIAVTKAIVEAGKLLDVEALDHLVIGNPKWVSLKERGLGF